ncbi:ABC transporter permease subunit [Thiorhodococcus mannitoliphagus]|uniref:ABC transporter permease subunit n=1 Tax=Thiorhodococcus mannitoliphagus TaxID=329406 RepID=A0A6P1DKN6_9GAMM|nr:ABC transporter permease subunit [Thiorhodococcus mannitoliphagus]NEX18787.1 ABC transporter permease subunit [Thiorhodococcus mannitoliphagus]
MIGAIAGREVRAGVVTPLLWVLLGVGQIVLAWIFLQVIEDFTGLNADERAAPLTQELTLNLFAFAGVVAMLAAPLLAMRMLSGELRDGSFDLIASSPVRLGQVVLGKMLGLAALITPLCLLPAANVLILSGVTSLDLGQLAASTLGLWLAAVMFCAIGLYASSLTSQPGAAVLAAFGLLLLLSVIGRADSTLAIQDLSLFGWLSWNEHLFWLLMGAVRLSDLSYFLLFTGFFLALTHRRLSNRRLQ